MRMEQIIDYLVNYMPSRRRDAWVYLGENYATLATEAYYAGLLYRVDASSSDLDGFVILCTQPVHSTVNWDMYTYTNGSIQRIDTLHIPEEFLTILTKTEFDSITSAPDPNFIPFQAQMEFVQQGGTQYPSIVIAESELHIILRDAGIPFVKWQELEYDVDTLRYLIVRPAVELYYKYFPIIRPQTVAVGAQGRFSVEIPKDPNFAVINGVFGTNNDKDANVMGMGTAFQYYRDLTLGGLFMGGHTFGGGAGSATGVGRRGRGAGSMIYNHNDIITNLNNTAVYKSMLNQYSRVKYTRTEDRVEGYHSGARFVTIEWGYMSEDWDSIIFERKPEVRELVGALALKTFGMLRSQTPENAPGKIDYSSWVTRGDAIEEKVIAHWHEFTKAVVIRSR